MDPNIPPRRKPALSRKLKHSKAKLEEDIVALRGEGGLIRMCVRGKTETSNETGAEQ